MNSWLATAIGWIARIAPRHVGKGSAPRIVRLEPDVPASMARRVVDHSLASDVVAARKALERARVQLDRVPPAPASTLESTTVFAVKLATSLRRLGCRLPLACDSVDRDILARWRERLDKDSDLRIRGLSPADASRLVAIRERIANDGLFFVVELLGEIGEIEGGLRRFADVAEGPMAQAINHACQDSISRDMVAAHGHWMETIGALAGSIAELEERLGALEERIAARVAREGWSAHLVPDERSALSSLVKKLARCEAAFESADTLMMRVWQLSGDLESSSPLDDARHWTRLATQGCDPSSAFWKWLGELRIHLDRAARGLSDCLGAEQHLADLRARFVVEATRITCRPSLAPIGEATWFNQLATESVERERQRRLEDPRRRGHLRVISRD